MGNFNSVPNPPQIPSQPAELMKKQKVDRQHFIDLTKRYVGEIPIEPERGGFGGTLPDTSKFNGFLDEVKELPVQDFVSSFAPEYVEKLSFDPSKAKYFDMFMDPAKRPVSDHYTPDNMALTPPQMEAFLKNGLVVTGDEQSMGLGYYKIFNNDLPVLITTDSILHAFHKSYDSILEELESTYCMSALKKIFDGMRQSLQEFAGKYETDPFNQSLRDADFFIAVAANLLNSEEYYRIGSSADPDVNGTRKQVDEKYRYRENPVKPQIQTILGGDDSVQLALEMCKVNKILRVPLFGKQRDIDFSLFKPRGHYAKSEKLRQYFRAVSWLGEIDMIIAGAGSNSRQLSAAVVLHMLLTHNKEAEKEYHTFSKTIEALVGPTNSMDFKQLDFLLNSIFKMKTFSNLNSEEVLQSLEAKILETDLGVKGYNSSGRRFTFMGKKFTIDNWLQTKLVTHDSGEKIMWNGAVVERHSSSCVEVAFAVLGNDAATSVIHDRMTAKEPEKKFRDGLLFHPNLVAGRKTIESLPAEEWSTSLYNYWLAALRKLSVPMDERFPQAMRTKAYAMKNMNAQLGSWAQLRHDNILYVEQGRRSFTCCDYPDGYVEPFVEFWNAMERMCMVAAQVMREVAPQIEGQRSRGGGSAAFFVKFAQHVRVLRDISELELQQKPLEESHVAFLKSVVEKYQTFGSGAGTYWLGWYPELFYGGKDDVMNPDLISCDTFTNEPNDMEPGCVVHQALGYPRRMIMAVDSGPNVRVYAGPVFGFYEFELPGTQRMSDEEWKAAIKNNQIPPVPEWTAPFLVV